MYDIRKALLANCFYSRIRRLEEVYLVWGTWDKHQRVR